MGIYDEIEPAAKDAFVTMIEANANLPVPDVFHISIAVSLKRIADIADRVAAPGKEADLWAFASNLAYEVGQNIGTGFERGRK